MLEITDAFLDVSPAVAFVVSKPAFQIALIDFRRDGTRCRKPLVFLPGDRDLHLFSNRLRQLALDSEHVPQLSIVGFRPEVLVGRAANQLGRDANPIALLA